jgi:predicted metalloprotease with PDZ domain
MAQACLSPGVVIKFDGVDINGVDDLIRALDRDHIDRKLELEVLRMGRLRAIDIHPIERKLAARQGAVAPRGEAVTDGSDRKVRALRHGRVLVPAIQCIREDALSAG